MTHHAKHSGRPRVALLAAALGAFAAILGATSALAIGPPLISSTGASHVTDTTATLEATINPNGVETEYRFEYISDAAYMANPESNRFAGATRFPVPSKSLPVVEEDVPVAATIEGLSPSTVYHYRVAAIRKAEVLRGSEETFTTYPTRFEGLPDGRAYEQASPVNKDGIDAIGTWLFAKAAPQGSAVTFISTFGVPGGVGAQELPMYLASRGSDWSTQGLLPPPGFGQKARVIGWRPDFSKFFEIATKYTDPQSTALLVRPRVGEPIAIVPYTSQAQYFFVGTSADGSKVLFESFSKLPTAPGTPEGIEGRPNVYVWDEATKQLSLVGVSNTDAQTKAELAKGAFAGPYDWIKGTNSITLDQGGSARDYYTQDTHAIVEDGSTYFTAAKSGQLYLRRNPTQKQSALNGEGKCTEPGKACTLHLSKTRKTNGQGPDGSDVAGTRPAAFMAATPDGSKAFFTSTEKLTNDATTGPEPEPPTIGRANVADGTGKEAEFIPEAAAAGMAISGEYLYWANPSAGTIERAKLNGAGDAGPVEKNFIVPGTIEVEEEGAEIVQVPSRPQYVAVDAGYLYWTDATDGKDGHGTVGRAKLGPGPTIPEADVEAEFVKGASNPQGIAVDGSSIYWANAGKSDSGRGIGRAEIGGGSPDQECIDFGAETQIPEGLAIEGGHLYWTKTGEFAADKGIYDDYVERDDLGCPTSEVNRKFYYLGQNFDVRGIATDGGHVYFVEQKKGAIGRADLDLTEASVDTEFLSAEGSLKGVAVDSERIYFSANGEIPVNPGNDLYRYEPDTDSLEDLTVDTADTAGAQVKGVLGASEDGSYIYFAANGDLDGPAGPASAGNCAGALGSAGQCNLYLWHEEPGGQQAISFVARLDVGGSNLQTDAANWVGSPTGLFPGQINFRKTAWMSDDGQTLVFRSQRQLTSYDNEGVSEFYRYRAGVPGVVCLTCNPSGTPPSGTPTLGTNYPSALSPETPATTASHNFADGGRRFFFETTDALVPADTNGEEGCLPVGAPSVPRCLDAYEWEAAGTGSCKEGAPAFSPKNGGCLYLLSSGKSNWSSFFLDASEDGEDAFIFTREGLVGQDKDELLDAYDVRVGGGIAAQNPPPPNPCASAEACHGPGAPPPVSESPGSASFVGPGDQNPKQQRKHAKKQKKKKHAKKSHGKKKHGRVEARGRASR